VTALVGATGSGKSTLLQLLMGFDAPQGGRVLIGDVDLAMIDPARWRDAVAWIPQQPHVFEGTVRDNLRLAASGRGADEATLRRAAERSGLADVVARLPQGWDTPLGERGLGLSGGELQRLAIARALLRESARVWLLDEPTAHLDADAAGRIDALIRAEAAFRTVLVVVHRLSAAQRADWVVVLRDGRVAEQGPPAVLARAGGGYAALLGAEQS
jgi:ATP-binding cassette subfamily C protein CydD